ncbi:aquaporin [Candidatus Saccharibacteria bacterium]|nr:aquaporin [Candidatus Saccharibacteria bacterium]
MTSKQRAAMLVAEFLGTFALASAVLAMITGGGDLLQTAVAAGFTLGLMVLVIGPVSGAHINPAVTLGLWSTRQVETAQAAAYWVAQMLGGLAAWKLHDYLRDVPLQSLGGAGFDGKLLVAEALGTLVFTFGIAAAVSRKYDGGKLAAAVGGSLFLGVLIAAELGSNAVLNPAVAVGIQSWSWTYAVAPLVGGALGMNLYTGLFAEPTKSKKK